METEKDERLRQGHEDQQKLKDHEARERELSSEKSRKEWSLVRDAATSLERTAVRLPNVLHTNGHHEK
jgi:hypothetical protein